MLEDFYSDASDTEEHDTIHDASEERLFTTKSMAKCIVLDNLPCVPDSKIVKLRNLISKLLSQIGPIVSFEMPKKNTTDATCLTAGFAFVSYGTVEEAAKAVLTINNFVLDKKHTIKVNLYTDLWNLQCRDNDESSSSSTNVSKVIDIPAYEEPVKEEFTPSQNYQAWCGDEKGRDMFALRYGRETEIHWYENNAEESTISYDGARESTNGKQWCASYIMWSPHGTYLATFHPQGIALWAGDTFEKVGRLAHKTVKIAKFSPLETYLVTCSEIESTTSGIIVWNVKTSQMLRAFPSIVQGMTCITPFRWSPDDSYVARRGTDVISIYETPSMKLLEKKSLPAVGVHNFLWSLTDNTLAYWAPESVNCPARVSLVEVPSRKEIRRKNLFSVSDCKLHWHPNGNYLCVKVTRHSKSKKTFFTNFELFRIREALVPVELLEMKDTIVSFAWEPKGTRFAVIFGDSALRLSVSFYDMCSGSGPRRSNELTLCYTLKDKACNAIYWSPLGNYVILAGLAEMNGSLEFWNTDEKVSLATQEHFKCTTVDWDQSGRVVATAVEQAINNSYYKYQMDNGYALWSFQGKNLMHVKKDTLYQFAWRPRPKSLLSDLEFANVVKNLKSYERKYHELDRKQTKAKLAAQVAEKARLATLFNQLVQSRHVNFRSRRQEFLNLFADGYDSEDDTHFITTVKVSDKTISQKTQIV